MQPIPDISALIKLAQSPAGQKLMEILRASETVDLQQAAAAASAGNMEQARDALSGILQSPEAQELLKQLEKKL